MIVFASNNGSGKSTFRSMMLEELLTEVDIAPDLLAKKYIGTKNNPELTCGKEAIRLVNECIERRKDFSIESTFAGNLIFRQILIELTPVSSIRKITLAFNMAIQSRKKELIRY